MTNQSEPLPGGGATPPSGATAVHRDRKPVSDGDLPRFLVGIDLGTTHTVVAFTDTRDATGGEIQVFEIEQLVAPGEVAPRALLPSLRYHPAPGELSEGDLGLPWGRSGAAENDPVVFGAKDLLKEFRAKECVLMLEAVQLYCLEQQLLRE